MIQLQHHSDQHLFHHNSALKTNPQWFVSPYNRLLTVDDDVCTWTCMKPASLPRILSPIYSFTWCNSLQRCLNNAPAPFPKPPSCKAARHGHADLYGFGGGFCFLQMCSIKVNMHWKKSLGYKLCVFVSWGKQYRKKALSQAIKLNIELHSSSCLSMPLLLMLPPKQGIKGLECGVGKSQALSLAARDICKSLCQKEREREGGWECKLETAGLYGMWLNSVLYFNELWGDAITTFWIFYSEVLKTMRVCQEKG